MKYERFRNLEGLSYEEAFKRVKEAPNKCPILGWEKCDLYYFSEGVVYLSNPAFYAFTIPEWDEEDRSFSYYRIDMDNDFSIEEFTIELDEIIEDGWSIKELEELYEIKLS